MVEVEVEAEVLFQTNRSIGYLRYQWPSTVWPRYRWWLLLGFNRRQIQLERSTCVLISALFWDKHCTFYFLPCALSKKRWMGAPRSVVGRTIQGVAMGMCACFTYWHCSRSEEPTLATLGRQSCETEGTATATTTWTFLSSSTDTTTTV